jgi:hypothetical protein
MVEELQVCKGASPSYPRDQLLALHAACDLAGNAMKPDTPVPIDLPTTQAVCFPSMYWGAADSGCNLDELMCDLHPASYQGPNYVERVIPAMVTAASEGERPECPTDTLMQSSTTSLPMERLEAKTLATCELPENDRVVRKSELYENDDGASIADTIFSDTDISQQLAGTTRAGTLVRSTGDIGHVPLGTIGIVYGYNSGCFMTQFFSRGLEPLVGLDGSHSAYWVPGTQLEEATGSLANLRGIRRLLVLRRHGPRVLPGHAAASRGDEHSRQEKAHQVARLSRIIGGIDTVREDNCDGMAQVPLKREGLRRRPVGQP